LVPVPLARLVREVLEREETSPALVRLELPEDMEGLADAELLGRAIGNLVRNAQRYAGDSGEIEIRADRSEDQIILRVRDSGPGVPEETLPRLFDPFYRPDASRARESGGTGLGLAIVRTCVEACGGTVSASLREPKGLEVAIRLLAA
jgi:two-component system sensor histidine kinase CpxA